MNVKDRQRGCFLGLAVGDALGAPVEFQPPGTFEPVTDFQDGGPHVLRAGEWTDDTSLALALADSINMAGWDLNHQAKRYVAWWKTGEYSSNGRVFDIGIATQRALRRFVDTGDARNAGSRNEYSSGNGSIMRLAPVPIAYHRCFPAQLELLNQRAHESSLPTHASPQCTSGCRYLAVILAGLIHGIDRELVLAPTWEPLQQIRRIEPLHPEVDEVANGSFRKRQPPEIEGSGYVVRSLEAALWAFNCSGTFSEAVLKAVNLGDDADTTGAVCGQLAGAYWGQSGIPIAWQNGLAEKQLLDEISFRLINGR